MPGGQIATTEYSASTGGYTSSANQQSPFTAVPDDGDAVCTPAGCNPNHTLVDLGHLRGHPGRVAPDRHLHRVRRLRRRIPATPTTPATGGWTPSRSTGPPRTITIPGTEFYVDLGLKSDLFSVTSTNGSTVSIVGPGLGARHRDGPVGRPRLRHRSGQRRRQLDLPADREPLLRPGARCRACRAATSLVGG